MICYRDMTFCSYWRKCLHGDEACGRILDKSVLHSARALGLPICRFDGKPGCFEALERYRARI